MKKLWREFNRKFWNLIHYNGYCFTLSIVMWATLCFTLISVPICQVEYKSHVAEHEQLRADWTKARWSRHHKEVEMILGQITESNQKIMECRWWNTVPYVSMVVPNGWDTLELIDIDPNQTRIDRENG